MDEYYEKLRERVRKYYRKNREKFRILARLRLKRKRGIGGANHADM